MMSRWYYTFFDYLLWVIITVFSAAICYRCYYIFLCERKEPYQYSWILRRKLSEAKPAQQVALLQAGLELYRKVCTLEPQNPIFAYEMGYLCWALSKRQNKEARRLRHQAIIALKQSVREMPAWGGAYYYLAQIYYQQGQLAAADYTMLRAHILAPYQSKCSPRLAEYWLQRWHQHPRDCYRTLIGERFYFYNQTNWQRYGKASLKVWEYIAPGISPWGTILPQQDQYALRAARFFVDQGNIAYARRLLKYVAEPQNTWRQYFIRGDIQLASNNIEKATQLYVRACQIAPRDKAEATFVKCGKKLIQSDNIPALIALLQQTAYDSLDMRLNFIRYAHSAGLSAQTLPWLQLTRRQFGSDARLEFMLSQTYLRSNKTWQAVFHAEQAFKKQSSRTSYARHLLLLLIDLQMDAKVDWYVQKYRHTFSQPATVYDYLAKAYAKHNQLSKAVIYARKANKLAPNNRTFRNRLQNIYRRITLSKP